MLNLEADTSFCACTQTDLQRLFLLKIEKYMKNFLGPLSLMEIERMIILGLFLMKVMEDVV